MRKSDRKKRVPLGSPQMKLTADVPKGKVGRWVNDKPGRLMAAQQGGYDFIEDEVHVGEGAEDGNSDLGARVSRVVGENADGTPLRAYLMVMDEKTYEADQAAKQLEVDKIDSAIMSGANQNTLGEHGYVPESGIKYQPKEE